MHSKHQDLDVIVIGNNTSYEDVFDPTTVLPSDFSLARILTPDQRVRIAGNLAFNGPAPTLQFHGQPMTATRCLEYFRAGRTFPRQISKHEVNRARMKGYARQGRHYLYLGGVLVLQYLRRVGFSAELVNDLAVESDFFSSQLERGPRAVVLSATFISQAWLLFGIISRLRSLGCTVPVIVGGRFIWQLMRFFDFVPHSMTGVKHLPDGRIRAPFLLPSQIPSDTNTLLLPDLHGMDTLKRCLDSINKGTLPTNLPNIGYVDARDIVFNRYTPQPSDVNSDIVRWDSLVDVRERYHGLWISMRITSGCPHSCQFCNFQMLQPEFKKKALPDVLREIAALAESGPTPAGISFVDDNLILSWTESETVAAFLKDKFEGTVPIISFAGYHFAARSDAIRHWADAGLKQILLGVESGSPLILKNMKKPGDSEKVLLGIRTANEHGISVYTTFLAGFPGENDETIAETIQFMNSIPRNSRAVNDFAVFPFFAAPGAPVTSARARKQWGLEGWLEHWKHKTMSSPDAVKAAIRIYLESSGPLYLYYPFPEEETGLTYDIADARRSLCAMDFADPGIVERMDRPEVKAAWDRLEQAVMQHSSARK